MARVDVLLTPTCPTVAPRLGQPMVEVGDGLKSRNVILSRLTRPFNLCGNPTISVTCGSDSKGMPIGPQLTGRLFDETGVLRVANAYEGDRGWGLGVT